jgi:hypothetical protein
MALLRLAFLFCLFFCLGRPIENKIHTLDHDTGIGWDNANVPWCRLR